MPRNSPWWFAVLLLSACLPALLPSSLPAARASSDGMSCSATMELLQTVAALCAPGKGILVRAMRARAVAAALMRFALRAPAAPTPPLNALSCAARGCAAPRPQTRAPRPSASGCADWLAVGQLLRCTRLPTRCKRPACRTAPPPGSQQVQLLRPARDGIHTRRELLARPLIPPPPRPPPSSAPAHPGPTAAGERGPAQQRGQPPRAARDAVHGRRHGGGDRRRGEAPPRHIA